jgi:Domain of unknown function (DUF5666)
MKCVRIAAILGALTLAVPAAAMAQTSTGKTQKSTAAASTKPTSTKKTTAPTASAKGVIKSTDETSLVITHAANKGPEQTFVLDSSTQKKGDLTVGATVDVKYRIADDGKKVATVVTAAAKKAPSKSKSTKKSSK